MVEQAFVPKIMLLLLGALALAGGVVAIIAVARLAMRKPVAGVVTAVVLLLVLAAGAAAVMVVRAPVYTAGRASRLMPVAVEVPMPPAPPEAPRLQRPRAVTITRGGVADERGPESVTIELGNLDLSEMRADLDELRVSAGEQELPPQATESVSRLAEESMPERLFEYFDRLAKETSPPAEALRTLRTELKKLTGSQRRALAAKIAAQRDAIATYRLKALSDLDGDPRDPGHYGVEAELEPDAILRQAVQARETSRRERPRFTRLSALGTCGVIVAAAIILKLATRWNRATGTTTIKV